MKAILVKKSDDEPILSWQDVPDIPYGPEQVLVDIKAIAVNRADLLQAQGLYPPPNGESEILGLEMCGEVVAVGTAAQGWQVGDRVLGLLSGGGYSQQVAVHPQMLIRLPDDWSFTEGAAIPEVWLTAFSNLFIDRVFPIEEAQAAHGRVRQNLNTGKVILEM